MAVPITGRRSRSSTPLIWYRWPSRERLEPSSTACRANAAAPTTVGMAMPSATPIVIDRRGPAGAPAKRLPQPPLSGKSMKARRNAQ